MNLIEKILQFDLNFNAFVSKLIHKPKYHEGRLITAHYLNLPSKMELAIEKARKAVGYNPYPLWKVVTYLYFAKQSEKVNGNYVELGVGKGFMSYAALAYRTEDSARKFLLFDKFDSLMVDQISGVVFEERTNKHYAKNVDEVKSIFKQFHEGVIIVKGILPESIDLNLIDKISFLHIDLNAAVPEVESLRLLWNRVTPGGIIILDDYAQEGRKEQFNAINQLAKELNFDVFSLPTGQGIIIK